MLFCQSSCTLMPQDLLLKNLNGAALLVLAVCFSGTETFQIKEVIQDIVNLYNIQKTQCQDNIKYGILKTEN